MKQILIRKVNEPSGWLSCMSAYPITHNGVLYRTCEHLFQCMRFPKNPEIQDHIRIQNSPMTAKMVAKSHAHLAEGVGSEGDLNNMRYCLKLKIEQYPDLKNKLIETKNAIIIEDCSARDNVSGRFWGMVRVGDEWEGTNWLGKLWMELRESLVKGNKDGTPISDTEYNRID